MSHTYKRSYFTPHEKILATTEPGIDVDMFYTVSPPLWTGIDVESWHRRGHVLYTPIATVAKPKVFSSAKTSQKTFQSCRDKNKTASLSTV